MDRYKNLLKPAPIDSLYTGVYSIGRHRDLHRVTYGMDGDACLLSIDHPSCFTFDNCSEDPRRDTLPVLGAMNSMTPFRLQTG